MELMFVLCFISLLVSHSLFEVSPSKNIKIYGNDI